MQRLEDYFDGLILHLASLLLPIYFMINFAQSQEKNRPSLHNYKLGLLTPRTTLEEKKRMGKKFPVFVMRVHVSISIPSVSPLFF